MSSLGIPAARDQLDRWFVAGSLASRGRHVGLLTTFLLGCGAVAAPAFVVVFTAEGARREGYDPIREPVSALSLGQRGWVQQTNFVATGGLMVAHAAGLRRAGIGRVGSRLVAAFGIGLVGAGLFATGPLPDARRDQRVSTPLGLGEALHDVFSLVAFGALAGACAVTARQFSRTGQWRWASYSAASAMMVVGGVGLFGQAFAGREPLARVGGLIQRLTISLGWGWLAVLAVHLLRPHG